MLQKYAKDFRHAGIRPDDDLSRPQQQERHNLDSDLQQLKTKSYKPFFRGSQLRYYSDSNMHACKKSHASRVPSA